MFKNRNPQMFMKAQLSSVLSTVADFLVTHLFTKVIGFWYLQSSVAGTILGGILNFLLGRMWVFQAEKHQKWLQVKKYILVWFGSLILNSIGIYVITELFQMHYMISKVGIAFTVGVFYNYYFQKKIVFQVR